MNWIIAHPMNWIIALGLIALVILLWNAYTPSVRVVSPRQVYVIDGDTISVRNQQGKSERIRIQNIDAPEMKKFIGLLTNSAGVAAQNELRALVRSADHVKIVTNNRRDRYGRTLALVRVVMKNKEIDVGHHLLRNGMARRWI